MMIRKPTDDFRKIRFTELGETTGKPLGPCVKIYKIA